MSELVKYLESLFPGETDEIIKKFQDLNQKILQDGFTKLLF